MDDKEWYEKGHANYFMSNFIHKDSRIDNIKDWVATYVPKGSKIVDIGCGDMSLCNLMPEHTWVGLDLDDKKDPRIVKQDVTKTPYAFDRGTFDAAVCSEVLEHLFDPLAVIQEAYRVIKPKGYFIVTVPNFDSLDNLLSYHREMLLDYNKFWTVEHIRLFNHQTMGKLLTDTGFKIIEQVGQSQCFSAMLVQSTKGFMEYVETKFKVKMTQAEADQAIGRLLPYNCPGIGFLTQKV